MATLDVALSGEGEGDAEPQFRRGDTDGSGDIDITDGIVVLSFLFLGSTELPCADAADVDDSGRVNITDGIFVLNFLFLGSAAPPAPGPRDCGEDSEAADDLDCALAPDCGV